ncbi:MAG: DNA-binding NarL/FixJ family response regulator [Crocinitomicaceae bacterium]|jgi:DNA-binding NarL/FixJ family response regulator
MKIILADDHQLILDGLLTVLKRQFPGEIFKGVLNKRELFQLLREEPFDILIQDLKFGADNAKDFLGDLRDEFPALKIILLTTVSDSVTIKQLSKKVDGYILKSESLEEIITAVNQVKIGNSYFSKLAEQKMNLLVPDDSIVLTRREREVLAIIMEEKSNKQIAEELFISEKTVELHRSNLFVKLDVKNITGLVKKTIALNLLD